jgi:hypothetical protein
MVKNALEYANTVASHSYTRISISLTVGENGNNPIRKTV